MFRRSLRSVGSWILAAPWTAPSLFLAVLALLLVPSLACGFTASRGNLSPITEVVRVTRVVPVTQAVPVTQVVPVERIVPVTVVVTPAPAKPATLPPAGAVQPGSPCTFGGPYQPDEHTLLLLHFDGSCTGAQGEAGLASGTEFTAGRYGQGVVVDGSDTLAYPATGNLSLTQGAIEFWLRPNWNGDDGQNYVFFEVGIGAEWFNRIRITKDGANNLRFMLWSSKAEYGLAHNVSDWRAGEWHHVAVTWQDTQIALYVDGEQVESTGQFRLPERLGEPIYVGSDSTSEIYRAEGVIDELRISDIPRIGNSDVCSTAAAPAETAPGQMPSCPAWDLAQDLRIYPNQENPNRDSYGRRNVWHFMQGVGAERDPRTYELLPLFVPNAFGVQGLEQWAGAHEGSGQDKLPAVGLNTTEQVQSPGTFEWPPNQVRVHPGSTPVIVGWQSPISGEIRISGLVRDMDGHGGDGVRWYVDRGSMPLASGGFGDGGSQNLVDGQGGDTLDRVSVSEGEFLYFIVDPNGSNGYDSTQLDIRIEPEVCPVTAGREQGGMSAAGWQPQSPPASPSPRCCMGLVYDSARQVIVAVGGGTWAQVSDETWEYDGTTWTLRQNLARPAPVRWTAAVAYNPDEQMTVLFGGKDQATFYNDTWQYDGRTWVKINALTPPSPRNGAKMAYDRNRRRMVLFGGYYGPDNVFFDETWEYEDGQWTQRLPAHRPPARESSALVYDARRGVVVLFGGGQAAGSTVYGDTWEWDGNDWIQRLDLPASPPARWAHSMTYDEDRQRTILFGGLTGTTAAFDDTWEYDGQTWTQVTAATRPPARWDPGLAYDPLHKRTVLFGGMDWDGNFGWSNDTWHYDASGPGPTPTPAARSPELPVVVDFSTTLEPGVWHGWVMRPSAADGGYIVEVTPLRPSVDGANVEKALVRPEYDGGQWNDVLHIQIPADLPSLEVNVRVYETSRLPVVAEWESVLTPGTWTGSVVGPAALDRGLVLEVTPLEPGVKGAYVEKALIQEEYFMGEWQDVLRAQIPADQPNLRVHFRVYATGSMPVLDEYEITLQPGVWTGIKLRPSVAEGGYVVEVNPVAAPSGSEFVERMAVQPEFDGRAWYDVLRLQAVAGQPALTVQVHVYGWGR